jgi:hypothetical protein
MRRCAQSSRSNVPAKYASARRIFARLASEIFLSSLQTLSESFDELRARPEFTEGTNGKRFEVIEKIPFMLSIVEAFIAFFSGIKSDDLSTFML